jgi:hypothetical protein
MTQPIRINTGISVTMPKRWLSQGESIPYTINNKYFQYSALEDEFTSYDDGYAPGLVAMSPNLIARLPPGIYRFAVHYYYTYYYYNRLDITNSSFRVLSNPASIVTDKKQYTKGNQVSIQYSLSTQNKIPLIGPYTIQVYPLNTSKYYSFNIQGYPENATSTLNVTLLLKEWPGYEVVGDFELRIDFNFGATVYTWVKSERIRIS